MSSRRKHLHDDRRKEVEIEWPRENFFIVRAQGSRGDNLIAVNFTDGSEALVLLPARFRKKFWIRKGSYLIIEQENRDNGGGRISGSIEAVLSQDDIKSLIERSLWPTEFMTSVETPQHSNQADEETPKTTSDSETDDSREELQPNTNRPSIFYEMSEEEEDEEE